MTTEEEAEMQKLHGLVERYRSRIVELKTKAAEYRRIIWELKSNARELGDNLSSLEEFHDEVCAEFADDPWSQKD